MDYEPPRSQYVDGALTKKLSLNSHSEQDNSSLHPIDSDQPDYSQRLLIAFAIFAVVCVLSLVGILSMSVDRSSNTGGADGVLGGDFVLHGIDGEVALSDFRGKVVVLYFGFLNCPEVCPTSMGIIQQALAKLDRKNRNNTQAILISIDPDRDSVTALSEFTRYFDENMIGLTGSKEQLAAVAANYGAYFKATASDSPELKYVFDHTSRYYVINQKGELVAAMRHSTTANELAARIRLLNESV